MRKPAHFYVYALVDPRSGEPFYIGKGSGRRMHGHALEARRGGKPINPAKTQRILDIWTAGLEVGYGVLASGLTDEDACAMERDLIRANQGKLLNISHGGRAATRRNDPRVEHFRQKCADLLHEVVLPKILAYLAKNVDETDKGVHWCRQFMRGLAA